MSIVDLVSKASGSIMADVLLGASGT